MYFLRAAGSVDGSLISSVMYHRPAGPGDDVAHGDPDADQVGSENWR